jgi:saccharopine dehydrogenase-like NADP-dependent oxidoreductase
VSDVVVFGGYGTFGQHVCRELVARGVTVTVAGRDGNRASAFATTLGSPQAGVRADVREIEDCRRALHGATVSVVCAGPFSFLGTAALEAARELGCHHVDIADDRGYVALARAQGARFAAAGRAVVPGCSSLPALSAALATAAAQELVEAPVSVRSTLFIGNDNPKGVAATASAVAGLGRPIAAPQGVLFGMREPERVDLPPPFGRRRVYSFDAPDYDLLPEMLGVRSVTVKVGFELGVASTLLAALARLPALGRRLGGPLARAGGLLRGIGSSGGAVMAEVFTETGVRSALALVAAADGQRMAALPAALVAQALVGHGQGLRGALLPDDVLGPRGLLTGMGAAGFTAVSA